MTSIAIHDPRRLSESDFLTGFIARGELVDRLLNQLQRTAVDGDSQHHVTLGQCGMGKTSLLRRLEIGIRQDPTLREAFVPLTVRERQYNLRSLSDFWHNCNDALAEWLEASGDLSAAARLATDRHIRTRDRSGSAAETFTLQVAATGRRPLLFIDNIDIVLDALSTAEQWQLRQMLQAPNGPVIYSSAQAIRQDADVNAPFYQFFQADRLEPLTTLESLRCIWRLAAARGGAGQHVAEILTREPQRPRLLHDMIGGNPRMLVLAYQVLERAESDTAFGDLEVLLDHLTPLYQARVGELRTELPRAILDAVAMHWDPITSHDLSLTAGVEITTVSSQLSRLKDQGLIKEVPSSGARSAYQLVDRLFNIWYLMHHGTWRIRQKINRLINFQQMFYARDHLEFLFYRSGLRSLAPEWQQALGEAFNDTKDGRADPGSPTGITCQYSNDRQQKGNAIQDQIKKLLLYCVVGQYLMAEAAVRELIRIDPSEAQQWRQLLGTLLADYLSRPAEAEEAYRAVIGLDATIGAAWDNLGNLLADHLGRPSEAEAAYEQALALGGLVADGARANHVWLSIDRQQHQKAQSLRNKLGKTEPGALARIDAALQLMQDNFGAATIHFGAALQDRPASPSLHFCRDLVRLLRFTQRTGYGERMLDWLEATGEAERHAPVYAAFLAYVRGERMLHNVNPEVRRSAQLIFDWLRDPPRDTLLPSPHGIQKRRTRAPRNR